MRSSFYIYAFLLLILAGFLHFQSVRQSPGNKGTLDSLDRLQRKAEALNQEYFDRVAQQVKLNLLSAPLPITPIPGVDKVRVEVLIVLTSEGELKGLTLRESSKSDELDGAVLAAIEKSQPFPTPPPSILREDESVYVGWSADFNMAQMRNTASGKDEVSKKAIR